ncbi:hypothetical protein GPX89_02375 [Nocardia sp. ET3-3]|uniref:Uncharacterized protein n=1 Tax=Nocardia terrae TaxID=2675851 RepID=A0A7K1UQB3_9NOCA|nr:hypothetical protein [Nocardia terrae]MVU76088.1 hypothetical protein [Nocardia terrae]
MSITLTDQDKITLRTAAYGAISLLAAADATGKPRKIAANGSIALTSATGPIGHVLAEKSSGVPLEGKSVAEIADQVLPALTASTTLLTKQDPAEAANFRSTVLLAIEAAQAHQTRPNPVLADLTRQITAALDAA